ncbi:Polyhomeotic-like protein 3 [Liparis tanakae]|uniref:Polyhomeotic-like protein 3 n=1 Tax=Liparis tanakae TaxID=230148 RepID=A0A4Z2E1N4_9TELE|nr:Polyhomeotic-like protein 3 [Liparis tanakae]
MRDRILEGPDPRGPGSMRDRIHADLDPRCEEVSSQFQSQEIDGQALLLLREEHLMSTMNVKLGPALKIVAHINALRD